MGHKGKKNKKIGQGFFLTISISFKLAYRDHCFLLPNNVKPLPSCDMVTAAKPQPSKPAANPTPKTAFPLHRDEPPDLLLLLPPCTFSTVFELLLLLANLRLAIDGAVDKRREAGTLFPEWVARPSVWGGMRGSALRIELVNMQAVSLKCSYHVMGRACDWIRGFAKQVMDMLDPWSCFPVGAGGCFRFAVVRSG